MKIRTKGNRHYFYCLGCKRNHFVDDTTWTYNGNSDNPTISPSILIIHDEEKYCCHSFIRNGNIEFLTDCTHKLAGMTVPLEDW